MIGTAARRHWLLLTMGALTVAAAAIAYGLERSPTYTATARLYVQIESHDPAALANVAQAQAALAVSFSRAVTATAVIDSAAGVTRTPPNTVARSVSGTPIPDSPVIKVAARAGQPQAAIRRANAVSVALASYVHDLTSSSSSPSANNPVRLILLNKAADTVSDRNSKLQILGFFGALAGLGLGLALALALNHARPLIRESAVADSRSEEMVTET